jgi:hypothetical protein
LSSGKIHRPGLCIRGRILENINILQVSLMHLFLLVQLAS